MTRIAIVKTGALGDVLRTTSVLPGLHKRYRSARITWITALGAVDLVARHPLVADVVALDPNNPDDVADAAHKLTREPWDRVLSFDDEEELCGLATALAGEDPERVLCGAYLDRAGARRYTRDAAPWFDMGLLSVHGKEKADRLKIANRRSHPEIFAAMLGIERGEPELPLPADALEFARELAAQAELGLRGPVVGLNTGAGGRWESKRLSVERTAELVHALHARMAGRVSFVLLGGRDEEERNAAIVKAVRGVRGVHLADGGTRNTIPRFAALIDGLDVLVASDSLAMHVAIARRVPVVAFFAPTSAAEIEIYGRGEKVQSTAPDYCCYRSDADTSTITAERLCAAVERVLAARGARRGRR